MKLSFNIQIFIGAILGILVGFVVGAQPLGNPIAGVVLYFSHLISQVFIGLLKMILIPLVFISISVGIARLKAHAQMNKVWRYSLIYFFSTSAIAATLGLICVNFFKLGRGLKVDFLNVQPLDVAQLTFPQFVENFIQNLFMNPFQAMAQNAILPTIVFAIFLGVALIAAGEKTSHVLRVMEGSFEVILVIVGAIMKILPIGIMALLIQLVSQQDLRLFSELGKYMILVLAIKAIHGFVVLPGILFLWTRRNIVHFYRDVKEVLLTAFSTSSSAATLPVTYRCAVDKLKVDKDVAGFVLPLGATMNMDGTALYEAVAALFVANIVGVHLHLFQQLIVVFMAVVASIGAPGIPSAGMVTMVMVFQSVGLPIEAIALLIPIDRPLDAFRTMINVEGDLIGSIIVTEATSDS